MNDTLSCCRVDVDENLIATAIKNLEEQKQSLEDKSQIFALLGNEVRLKIVTLFLEYKELCVCDLSDILQMKQSPISQHLRKLKDGAILQNKREGMTVFYSLSPRHKEYLINILKG